MLEIYLAHGCNIFLLSNVLCVHDMVGPEAPSPHPRQVPRDTCHHPCSLTITSRSLLPRIKIHCHCMPKIDICKHGPTTHRQQTLSLGPQFFRPTRQNPDGWKPRIYKGYSSRCSGRRKLELDSSRGSLMPSPCFPSFHRHGHLSS